MFMYVSTNKERGIHIHSAIKEDLDTAQGVTHADIIDRKIFRHEYLFGSW